MNIIILGAGRVGGTLAESLLTEGNDITVVDTVPATLKLLQEQLDIRTVVGSGSHPDVLAEAGANDADMVIAVTNQDETNITACQICHTLYKTPLKMARIRSSSYLEHPELFQNNAIPIDVCISPEQMVMKYISRLIEFPGALQVLDFAEGKVQLVALRPDFGGPLVGKSIASLCDHLPEVELQVAAIFRQDSSIPVDDSTIIEVGDEVFIVATPAHIHEIMQALGRFHKPYKRVFIAGGGHVGSRLASALESDYQVKVIEHNTQTAARLSSKLNATTVLLGDASDKKLLLEENIESCDVFVSVTNSDEANIMSCMQAKRLGVRQVIALVNRSSYVDLIEGGPIDVAVSPQQATIGGILTYLRQGDVANVYSLRRGAAEAIEVIAHGDKTTSKVVGSAVKDIKLPPGTVIGAIVRGEKTVFVNNDTVIEAEDHIVLFVTDKKHIHDVERLFQVNVTYFS